MLKRFTVVAAVLLTALFLQFLQNKWWVVEKQDLSTEIRPSAEQPKDAKAFDLVFKDVAGNPVEARPGDVDTVISRLKGGGRKPEIVVAGVAFDPTAHVLRITAPPTIDELALRQRVTGEPMARAGEARDFWHVNLGIDLRGGVEFTCRLKNDEGHVVAADDEVVATLRGRLDERGLSEPVVARLSNGDVQVVIPGGTRADAARTRKVLETTGRLEFREVITDYPNAEFPSAVAGDERCAWVKAGNNLYKFNPRVAVGTRQDVIAPMQPEVGLEPSKFIHLGPSRLTGKDVADAQGTLDEGRPAVSITFDAVGAGRNHEFTTNVKERGNTGAGSGRLAIVFDGVIKSAPWVKEPSSSHCLITGSFTEAEVKDLRGVLRAGSLAVTPEILSERVVGSTLGHQEVQRALVTMGWCMLAIVAFLAWYYRRLGLVAIVSMGACAMLTWTTLAVFGATLSLPGIAGLILSIAMSIDTNVLIYERIREELKLDQGLPAAISAGYDRAFLTILDSNLTTMATGLVLYVIGTGPVKGFGLTLIIGIGISMFSGIYLGRLLTDWMTRGRQMVSMSAFFKPLPAPYVRLRWASYILTAITAVAGIGYFAVGHKIFHPGQGFDRNFDIEFTGGTMVQVSFTEPLSVDTLDESLKAAWDRIPANQRQDSLLNPDEIQKQPYFANLAVAGSISRQWVFRIRDVVGAGLERERNELEQQRGAILRDIEAKRTAQPPDIAGARLLEKEQLAPLVAKVQAASDRILDRTDAFKRALATAFAGKVAAEGDEVTACSFTDNKLTVRVALMEEAGPLQAGEVSRRLAHLGREVTATAMGREMQLTVRYADHPRPSAGAIDSLDPVSRRCAALLAMDAGAEATALGAVAGPVVESLVDAAASQRLTVAQPFPATQHFSGQVADRMKWQALVAVSVSLLAMMLYIAARFEMAYGLGATVSLLHVVVQTVGLIVLFGVRIDLTVIAGILTVIGYAINDTIVLYDRIREYVGKMAGQPLGKIIDAAIADTMPRTILTGGMVVASLAFMLVFAGDSLKGFSATLLIGILLGTYSSVFVASPLLLSFSRRVLAPPAPPAPPAETAPSDAQPG